MCPIQNSLSGTLILVNALKTPGTVSKSPHSDPVLLLESVKVGLVVMKTECCDVFQKNLCRFYLVERDSGNGC